MPNTMAVYGIKGDKAYVIDYIAGSKATYSNYLPIAQKMIDSFQIVNAKTTTPTIATTASSSATQTNPNNKNATEKTTTLSPPASPTPTTSNEPPSSGSSHNGIAELEAAREQLLLAWNYQFSGPI